MPIVWPVALPDLPLMGWGETFAETRVRTQTDTGPAKVRQRSTAGVRNLSLPFALTESQMGTLDTFFHTDTAGGSLRFEWEHPRTGVTYEMRFLDPPQFAETDRGLYRGTISIEVLP